MSDHFNARFLLRRLPWYIGFCIVFGPLILAPFTLGASLIWYPMYFVAPFIDGKTTSENLLVVWGIPIAAGFLLWLMRAFVGLFIYYWIGDHFTAD